MPEPDFQRLRQRLLESGVTVRNARRITEELREHYHDLCEEAALLGLAGERVTEYADRRLGSERDLARAVLAQSALRSWIYRYPYVARVALPIVYVSLLPAVPLIAGVNHASLLARWGACLMLSGLFTGTLMLLLYLSILAT